MCLDVASRSSRGVPAGFSAEVRSKPGDTCDRGLQLLARVERDDAARRDGNLFAGLRVAARPRRLVSQLEISETRQLYRLSSLECLADLIEEAIDHILGLALVQAQTIKQHLGQFGLGHRLCSALAGSTARRRRRELGELESRCHLGIVSHHGHCRSRAPKLRFSSSTTAATAASASVSLSGLAVSCRTIRKARLFSLFNNALAGTSRVDAAAEGRYTSNSRSSCSADNRSSARDRVSIAVTICWYETDSSTQTAMSRCNG